MKQIDLERGTKKTLGVEKMARPHTESFLNVAGNTETFSLETEYDILKALSRVVLFPMGKWIFISAPLTFGCLLKILLDTNIFMLQSRHLFVMGSCSFFLPLADE